jgi:hypothetical protein
MKNIIAHVTGKDVKSLHTRGWKMDNNQIWAFIDKLPLHPTGTPNAGYPMGPALLHVDEILKLTKGWRETRFVAFQKTTNGPVHLEVEK